MAAIILVFVGFFGAAAPRAQTETLEPSDVGEVIANMEQRFIEKVDIRGLFTLTAQGMDGFLRTQGAVAPLFTKIPFTNSVRDNVKMLDEALAGLEGSGMCTVPSSRLLMEGMRHMLASFKDHGTKFFGPGEYTPTLEEMGYNVGGCGFFVDHHPVPEGGFVATMVLKGFPAEKEGILPGDRLVKVDGKDVTALTFELLAGHVRGPVGTKVLLTMIREGEKAPLEFTITRTWLSPNTTCIDTDIIDRNVGYLKLRYLGKRVSVDFRESVAELEAKGVNRLIIDLRNNEGDADGAVSLAGLFLPNYAPIVNRIFKESTERFKSLDGEKLRMPAVLLVNRYTSSSATIFAGALQDAKVVTVVGSPTRWIDSLRESEQVKDCMYTITRGYYKLPGGRTFRMDGDSLEPDVLVEQAPFAAKSREQDRQLQKALQLVKEKK